MQLQLTRKAQEVITEGNDSVTVRLEQQICYGWRGTKSKDIPSVRWGKPELAEISEYEQVNIDGMTIYVHSAIKCGEMTRIDALTGKDGAKLMLLGYME